MLVYSNRRDAPLAGVSDGARERIVRLVPKDVIRFEVPAGGAAPAAVVEVSVRPDRFGWAATARLHPADGAPVAPLPRVFRARDRSLAAGKMVAWVRRRFEGARPVAERRAGGSPPPSTIAES